MSAADVVVLLAYATLLVEIVFFPIPSEASTWQLLEARGDGAGSGALARARQRPLAAKLFFYLLPTAAGVVLFLVPLAAAVLPAVREELGTWASEPAAAAGLSLVVLGRGLTFTSVLQLRAQRRAGGGPPPGLFRWSRNPGLVGMFVLYAGLALVCGVPWLWLGLPLYVGNMHRRVLMEEAHLLARLGDAWSTYAARVPRYVGLRRVGSAP